MTLIILMMIRILARVILILRRTVVHSVGIGITSSKQSSSQTSVRVTQQMGDEVTLIKQK